MIVHLPGNVRLIELETFGVVNLDGLFWNGYDQVKEKPVPPVMGMSGFFLCRIVLLFRGIFPGVVIGIELSF